MRHANRARAKQLVIGNAVERSRVFEGSADGVSPAQGVSSAPAPGWYPAPGGVGLRWWDGSAWAVSAREASIGGWESTERVTSSANAAYPIPNELSVDPMIDEYVEAVVNMRDTAFERLRVGAWAALCLAVVVAAGGVLSAAVLLGRTQYLSGVVLGSASLAVAGTLMLFACWALAYVAERQIDDMS